MCKYYYPRLSSKLTRPDTCFFTIFKIQIVRFWDWDVRWWTKKGPRINVALLQTESF